MDDCGNWPVNTGYVSFPSLCSPDSLWQKVHIATFDAGPRALEPNVV